MPREWDRLPEGRSRNTSRELYGGDLRGVEQHLDHIEGLGANLLYLTPFFPARSIHRYDASSFDQVDPLLGGDDALRSLLRAAHDARHARRRRPHAQPLRRRARVVPRAPSRTPSAPERELFFFDGSPPLGYACWLGIRSLPTLNWSSPELRRRMERVLRHWLDEGLDGWRIDVANMVGRYRLLDVNHDVAALTRDLVRGKLLVAEHGHDYRPDLDGRGWHGVMNYAGFLRPTWWWLHGGDARGGRLLAHARAGVLGPGGGRGDARRSAPACPGTPSSTRGRCSTATTPPASAPSPASRAKHVVGIGLQMTTPGVPMIFAGDELGLEGEWGEDARRTMPWDRPETWDTDASRELPRAHRAAALEPCARAAAACATVHVADDAIAYLRESREERLLCLAARAPHDPITVPFTQLETLYGDDARNGVLPADGPAFHVWRITDG